MTKRIDASKIIVLVLAAAALACLVAWTFHRHIIAGVQANHWAHTRGLAQSLDSQYIGRLRGAALALAQDRHIVETASGVLGMDNPGTLVVLETTRINFSADIVYVMNAAGDVLASTRFNDMYLTGKNYAFRPYFMEAMQGKPSLYPAMGVTTMERGFYAGAPVRDGAGAPAGALVIKSGLGPVDRILFDTADAVALVSPQGVVFAANRHEWLFRLSGQPLAVEQMAALRKSRQFGDRPLEALPRGLTLDQAWVTINGQRHAVVRVPVGIADASGQPWELVSARPYSLGYPMAQLLLLSVATALMVMISGVYFLSRQAQAALKREAEASRDRLAQVIDFLPDATFVIDHEGKVIAWNRAIEKMTAIAAKDILGKTNSAYSLAFYNEPRPMLIDLVNRPDPVIEQRYAFVRRQEDMLVAEATSDHLRFANAYLLGLARPIYDVDGNVVGAIECIRDVSEYRVAEAEIRRSEARLRSLVDLLQEPFASTQVFLDRVLAEALHLTQSRIGYIYHYSEQRKEFVLNSWSKEVMQDCAVTKPQTCYELDNTGIWGEAVRQGRPILLNDFHADHPLKKGYPPGHVPLNRFMTVPVFSAGRIVAVVGVANKPSDYGESDVLQLTLLMEAVWKVVDRRKAEEDLTNEQERFRILVDSSPFGVALIGPDGTTKYLNPTFVKMFGYTPEDIPTGRQWMDRAFPDPALRKTAISAWVEDLTGSGTGRPRPRIFTVTCKDGTQKVIHFRPVSLHTGDEVVIYEDITEKRQLEAQFLQAQKMESVGRLAGGVAHDFNNMLQAILGQTELGLMGIGSDHSLYAHLQQIRQAAWRSADLVRQLLAFARKQTASPKVLDLNDTVAGMLKMLRRLIGEDIDLAWMPGHALGLVKIDPSQVDQVLANLAVNARDAISGVGKVTIETENIVLDDAYCADRAGFVPGQYVMLGVSDDGCGMDHGTMEHIFEPFFTTKAVGQGTGLGLATVYGIVKQNNGFINVYSEPGQGTSFKIYLPRCQGEAAPEAVAENEAPLPSGTETILVVEDDTVILAMGQNMLQRLGYRVLTANSPSRALELAGEQAGGIDLLITDVVMPEMNGKDLANRLALIRPQVKCLFMSGYTANVIAHHGVLDAGVSFIQKPFSIKALALKVRAVLEGGQGG